jgi:hypothetical protein
MRQSTQITQNTAVVSKKVKYGSVEGSVVAFKDGKHPLTIPQAQKLLAGVESRREFVQLKDPSRLQIKSGSLFYGNKPVGKMSNQGYQALKHHTRLGKSTDSEINHVLSTRDWEGTSLQARVDLDTRTVNGVLTNRYEHLPYQELLSGFSDDFVIPRIQVDSRMVQIHITNLNSSLDKSDRIFMGGRILSSDVGLLRAMLLDEMLRLICTNGLIRATLEAFWKRYHFTGARPVREEWHDQVVAFQKHILVKSAVERKKISHARSLKVTDEDVRKELAQLGLGVARINGAIDYATREFGAQLSRWSITQGITYVSQFQRGETALPTSVTVATDVDVLAAQYMAAAA